MSTTVPALVKSALALCLLASLATAQSQTFRRTGAGHGWSLSDSQMDALCQSEFGSSYRLATWGEVNAFVGQHGLGEFYTQSGMTQYRDNGWLRGFYSSNRRYFAERHDGNVPAGWLVHQSIGNNDIDLGSWQNSRPCLCVTDEPQQATVSISGSGLTWVAAPALDSPTFQLQATGSPAGGSYVWEVPSGGLAIVATNQGSATFRALTPSTQPGDVSVKVTYTPPSGSPASDTHPLTIQRPCGLRVVGSNTIQVSGGYETNYLFSVQNQFGADLDPGGTCLPVTERVVVTATSHPFRCATQVQLGSHCSTDSTFLDTYAPNCDPWGVPDNLFMRARQRHVAGGWVVSERNVFFTGTQAHSLETASFCP